MSFVGEVLTARQDVIAGYDETLCIKCSNTHGGFIQHDNLKVIQTSKFTLCNTNNEAVVKSPGPSGGLTDKTIDYAPSFDCYTAISGAETFTECTSGSSSNLLKEATASSAHDSTEACYLYCYGSTDGDISADLKFFAYDSGDYCKCYSTCDKGTTASGFNNVYDLLSSSFSKTCTPHNYPAGTYSGVVTSMTTQCA